MEFLRMKTAVDNVTTNIMMAEIEFQHSLHEQGHPDDV